MDSTGPRRVVIVGAGLGGTATAVRLLRFAREPLQVVVVERRPEYRSAGVAYHPAGNHWHHVFNIQAGRMSMFREDVDDFLTWANHEADRTGWPPQWSGLTFTESGPAPRRIYAGYLAARLAEAAREAFDGVTLLEADGEVVDLTVVADGVDVVVEDRPGPGRRVLRADHVVLATGLEERGPPFAAGVRDHPAFVRHPYSEEGIERILGLRRDAVVAIVGTLLSAYDSASLLLRNGHTGRIHMISRSGLTLRTYPSDHRHQVLGLPDPRLPAGGYAGRDDLVRRLRDEWERACAAVAREHPAVDPLVVTERVAKSWEPHLPEALARVPSDDLRALLDGYGSLLATLRVGAVAYITELVDAALAGGGPIALTTGRVDGITATETGTLRLSVSGPTSEREIEADLVISNFGREPDYGRARRSGRTCCGRGSPHGTGAPGAASRWTTAAPCSDRTAPAPARSPWSAAPGRATRSCATAGWARSRSTSPRSRTTRWASPRPCCTGSNPTTTSGPVTWPWPRRGRPTRSPARSCSTCTGWPRGAAATARS
ncbi:FAD/NAD(P)-binding protein [Actinomadura namibiensis]|uniref:FAD/NAD(P)-binding protein n=1 Tax=Actinomadura kijaniata TaxID=46161 RepID=UPI003605E370